jgi:hypothetical protein
VSQAIRASRTASNASMRESLRSMSALLFIVFYARFLWIVHSTFDKKSEAVPNIYLEFHPDARRA